MPYPFLCPQCKDPHWIDVDATVRVRILQDEDGNHETDADASEDGSHEWDGNSIARCASCGYTGIMSTFMPPEDAPDPHPRWCECGRDWDDCSTRDTDDPDAEHQDRLLQPSAPDQKGVWVCECGRQCNAWYCNTCGNRWDAPGNPETPHRGIVAP